MNNTINNRSAQVWRMAIILLGVLMLCSCRSDPGAGTAVV